VAAPLRSSQSQTPDLAPEQIAVLKKQLQAANARLIALERERRELKKNAAALAALMKRIETKPST
jgi:hypothetical protein